MENLAALTDLANGLLWHGFIVFLRVGAMVSLLPVFGEQAIPGRIKVAMALAFTAIVAPGITLPPLAPTVDNGLWLVLSETMAGFLLGIGLRLMMLALQTAGAIAAQSTSLSQLLGGASVEPLAAIGYILTVGALALAVIMGLHIKAAQLMIYSYELLPPGLLVEGSDLADWGVRQVSRAFQLAFTLAAPFVLVSILYNLALGVINKAMPQLMVAFVGAPVITAGGLLMLFLASPLMLTVWMEALDKMLINPFGPQP